MIVTELASQAQEPCLQKYSEVNLLYVCVCCSQHCWYVVEVTVC